MKMFLMMNLIGLAVGLFSADSAEAKCKCKPGYKPAWEYIDQKCILNGVKLDKPGGIPVDKQGKPLSAAMATRQKSTTIRCLPN